MINLLVLLGTFLESPDNFSGRERCFTRQNFTPKCCVGLSSQIRRTCNTMTLQSLHSKSGAFIDIALCLPLQSPNENEFQSGYAFFF